MNATLPAASAMLGALVLLPACGSIRHRADVARAAAEITALPEATTPPDIQHAPVSTIEAAPVAAPIPIGLSREGRPLTAATMGQGPLRVYLVGGIHGDEPEGQGAIANVRRALLASDAGGGSLASQVTLRILDDMNPDGTFHTSRTNAAGVDLNRNWPAVNFRPSAAAARAGINRGAGTDPLSEPETVAAHADIAAFDPHIILVLHSSFRGPFVNFDGPSAAEALAGNFGAAAADAETDPGGAPSRWRVVAEMGYPTPGSMGSYFGDDLGLPILTVEYKRTNRTSVGGPDAAAALLAGLRAVASGASFAQTPLSQVAARIEPAASEGN